MGQVASNRRTIEAYLDGANLVFCDIFEMQDARIRRLTSYLMEIK